MLGIICALVITANGRPFFNNLYNRRVIRPGGNKPHFPMEEIAPTKEAKSPVEIAGLLDSIMNEVQAQNVYKLVEVNKAAIENEVEEQSSQFWQDLLKDNLPKVLDHLISSG